MADRGTGFVNPAVPDTDIVAFDYSFNWTPHNYGDGFVLSPTGVTGGPGGFYMGLGVGLDPVPPTPPAARGAGPMVVIALPGGRSVQVPL